MCAVTNIVCAFSLQVILSLVVSDKKLLVSENSPEVGSATFVDVPLLPYKRAYRTDRALCGRCKTHFERKAALKFHRKVELRRLAFAKSKMLMKKKVRFSALNYRCGDLIAPAHPSPSDCII